jgi:hypothetical protein
MSWCRSLCGLSPKVGQQIERKLREIVAVYPNTQCCVILSREGHVIAQTDDPQYAVPDELLAPIASLKKTAVEFGQHHASHCLRLLSCGAFS